jgi:predicted nucleic acid-binding protein
MMNPRPVEDRVKAYFAVTGDRTLLSVAEYEGVRIVSVNEALEAVAQSASHNRQ